MINPPAAGELPADDRAPHPVRLGVSWQALAGQAVVFLAVYAVIVLVEGRSTLAWWLGLVFAAASLVPPASVGITLTPAALRIRGLSPRTLPWHTIGRITVRDVRSGRIVEVWVDGRPIRLPYPLGYRPATPGSRARFDRQYSQVVQWWTHHRGDGSALS